MKTIFLSYARTDVISARKLVADLRNMGLRVWFDEDSLLPGQQWRSEIERAIRDADFFLTLLSSKSVNTRGYVQAEIAKALSVLEECPPNKIFIIPARLDECEPSHPRLRDLHRVDLFPDWELAIRKIVLATGGTLDEGIYELSMKNKSTESSVWANFPKHLSEDKSALLISDGTDFAAELGAIAQGEGFNLITVPPLPLINRQMRAIEKGSLVPHGLVILVRGEGFTQIGNKQFYSELRRFVFDGGNLFATPWVAWENKLHDRLSDALPFEHVRDTYNENVMVTCRPTQNELSTKLFYPEISFHSSFEELIPRANSVVLCEMDNGIPLFGYTRIGSGLCYYLNTCQHFCSGTMLSPLQTSMALRSSLRQIFKWIFESSA